MTGRWAGGRVARPPEAEAAVACRGRGRNPTPQQAHTECPHRFLRSGRSAVRLFDAAL